MKKYKIIVERRVIVDGVCVFAKIDIEANNLKLEEAKRRMALEGKMAMSGVYGEKSTIERFDERTICKYDGGWAMFHTDIRIVQQN